MKLIRPLHARKLMPAEARALPPDLSTPVQSNIPPRPIHTIAAADVAWVLPTTRVYRLPVPARHAHYLINHLRRNSKDNDEC